MVRHNNREHESMIQSFLTYVKMSYCCCEAAWPSGLRAPDLKSGDPEFKSRSDH